MEKSLNQGRGRIARTATFLKKKLLRPFVLSLGLSTAGAGYLIREPIEHRATEVAFEVRLAMAPITAQERAFLKHQHQMVQERQKKRQRVIWEHRAEAEQFYDEMEKIADGSMASLERFKGANAPDRLLQRNEIYRYGLEQATVSRAESFFEKKITSLAKLKSSSPPSDFLRELIRKFAPGMAYELSRSSAIESLSTGIGKCTQNCDARTKIFIMVLSRLYPDQLQNIFVQSFGDHVRVLFKIGNITYILEGEGETFPDAKTEENPSLVVPLSGYLGKKLAGISFEKIEGVRFYGPEDSRSEEFQFAITDAVDPFSLDDLFVAQRLGNFSSLRQAMNSALQRAERKGRAHSAAVLQAERATQKPEVPAVQKNVPAPREDKKAEIPDQPRIKTPEPPPLTQDQLEKVIAQGKINEERMERKLDAIIQTERKNEQQTVSGLVPFYLGKAGDVIETDILREDPRYQLLTLEEVRRVYQQDIDELSKYEHLEDPEAAKELVRVALVRTLNGNGGHASAALPYENALREVDLLSRNRKDVYSYSSLRLTIKDLPLSVAEYLKDTPGGMDFYGLVLNQALADVFSRSKHGYFVFYRLPPLDVLKNLKIKGKIVVKEQMNEEYARVLVDIPMEVEIDGSMPPESLERVLPILKQKQQFYHDISWLKRMTPKLFDELLQTASSKSISIYAEEFSADLVELCQQHAIQEVNFLALKHMDEETSRAFAEAGIAVKVSRDFVVHDTQSLASVFQDSPEFILDGSSEELEDIFAWLRESELVQARNRRTIRVVNFPLTPSNARLLLGIRNVAINLEQCGPLTDDAAEIWREAAAEITIGREQLTPKILDFLVAQRKLLQFWDADELDLDHSSFSESERQQLFSDPALIRWLTAFRGRLNLPRSHVFQSDDPVLLTIIGQQRYLEFDVVGPLSPVFVQKMKEFKGGNLLVRGHNISPEEEASFKHNEKVWLDIVSK